MNVLVELQRRIESTNALIAQHERAVAEVGDNPPRSLLANIRAIEKVKHRLEAEFLEVVTGLDLEVYRYRILNESERVTLPGIAEAWLKFQEFFSSVYSALTEADRPKHKKLPQSAKARYSNLELGYGYSFASSVGVVVTVPREVGIYASAPIDEASTTVFNLIEAKGVSDIARNLGPKPIKAFHDWIGIHIAHHYGLGLEWHSGGTVKRQAEIQYQSLGRLQSAIGNTITTAVLDVAGKLYAVDEKKKEFKFEGDNGQHYSGSFKDAITDEHAASVPARYRAQITQTTKIVVLGNEPETVFSLDNLKSF